MTANTNFATLFFGDSTHDIREEDWVNAEGWVPPPDDDDDFDLD